MPTKPLTDLLVHLSLKEEFRKELFAIASRDDRKEFIKSKFPGLTDDDANAVVDGPDQALEVKIKNTQFPTGGDLNIAGMPQEGSQPSTRTAASSDMPLHAALELLAAALRREAGGS
jgi:hypothetical protein